MYNAPVMWDLSARAPPRMLNKDKNKNLGLVEDNVSFTKKNTARRVTKWRQNMYRGPELPNPTSQSTVATSPVDMSCHFQCT